MRHDDLNEEEKPLDPAVERVRARMLRLQAVSTGIMVVGLMAVLGAIVYKISGREEAPAASVSPAGAPAQDLGVAPGFAGRLELPQGSQILSASLDGSRALIVVQHGDGRREMLVYSFPQDGVIARIAIE